MKQILQNLRSGETVIADVPCPGVRPGHLLIRTAVSLVSVGTERMLLEFGKANFIDKARQQPDKVRMVLDKIKTDGLMPTVQSVQNKLDQPLPLGYCNVGTVMEIGGGVDAFSIGDRVVSNGKHAEMVLVPKNLCAKVPDQVTNDAAVFTVVGAIGLQGIRLAQPTLGESFAVTGLGLIGLLAVQLLRANGCRVLGLDFDPQKLALARALGAETVDLSKGEDPVNAAVAFSRGRGIDGVIITASTKSKDPVHQAANMCRKRGRIVLVGVVGLELSRADFYDKELSFQVSCSYGPGRYDPLYEEGGHDYPVGFVRWTEQRNFEAVLDMMREGRLDTSPLVSHRFPIEKAPDAYDVVSKENPLGVLLEYGAGAAAAERTEARMIRLNKGPARDRGAAQEPVVAFVGSGNYATQILIPAFKATSARLKSIASAAGVSGVHAGKKYGFEETTTDTRKVFSDPEVNTLVIATRHDTHARLLCDALKAGKRVFVEKPLALDRAQLREIESTYASLVAEAKTPFVMVGFNRRFAPHTQMMKALLDRSHEPKSFIMTVNAGAIPGEHWIQDKEVGGGRIIGEGCHFVDLLRFLAGAPIVSVQATMIGEGGPAIRDDKATFTLVFADGSFGTVHYLANGHKSFPKERLEVFSGGGILQLDNFRALRSYGWPGMKKKSSLWKQDKGNMACASAFIDAIRNGKPAPIPFDELIEVSHRTLDIVEALQAE